MPASEANRLLRKKIVRFWLSPDGKLAVKKIFDDKDAFQAWVEEVDDLGLWIRPAKRNQLLLLKWIYVATAQLDVEPIDELEQGAPKQVIH